VTRDRLVVGEHYFLRIKQHQIPVEFCGALPVGLGSRKLVFRELSTGNPVYRKSANTVSLHADSCCIWDRSLCDCYKQLGKDSRDQIVATKCCMQLISQAVH
jgi:hypothetical protein